MTDVMMEYRCSKNIYSPKSTPGGYVCTKIAVVQEDGQWFCSQHAPSEVKKRNKESGIREGDRQMKVMNNEASELLEQIAAAEKKAKLFPDMLAALERCWDVVSGQRCAPFFSEVPKVIARAKAIDND